MAAEICLLTPLIYQHHSQQANRRFNRRADHLFNQAQAPLHSQVYSQVLLQLHSQVTNPAYNPARNQAINLAVTRQLNHHQDQQINQFKDRQRSLRLSQAHNQPRSRVCNQQINQRANHRVHQQLSPLTNLLPSPAYNHQDSPHLVPVYNQLVDPPCSRRRLQLISQADSQQGSQVRIRRLSQQERPQRSPAADQVHNHQHNQLVNLVLRHLYNPAASHRRNPPVSLALSHQAAQRCSLVRVPQVSPAGNLLHSPARSQVHIRRHSRPHNPVINLLEFQLPSHRLAHQANRVDDHRRSPAVLQVCSHRRIQPRNQARVLRCSLPINQVHNRHAGPAHSPRRSRVVVPALSRAAGHQHSRRVRQQLNRLLNHLQGRVLNHLEYLPVNPHRGLLCSRQ